MTIINPNSISGISSITALNSTAAINLFKADGTSANIIAGVVTAATFKGAFQATSASFSGNIDANGDLDVDGHTNLDNVSIAGVVTVTGGVSVDNVNIGITGDNEINTSSGDLTIDSATGQTVIDDNLSVTGVSTFTGAIDANGDLDVDGHTNLDNVSIAGITTTTENIRIQGNNKYFTVGASNQIGVVHTGGEAFITNSSGHFTHRSDVHKWENNAGSAEYLRIDSSGRLLVGTTSAGSSGVDNLILYKNGNGGLTIRNNSNQNGNIFFSRGTSGTDEYKGYIQYQHAQDAMILATGHTERLRIESWGGIQNNQGAIYGGGVANEPKVHFNGAAPSADADRGQFAVSDSAAYNASPIARISLVTRYNSSGGYTFMGGIEGGKANTTDNNFDGFVRLMVRKHGQGNIEALRITSTGNLISKGVRGSTVHNVSTADVEIGGRHIWNRIESSNNATTSGATQFKIKFFRTGSGNVISCYYRGVVVNVTAGGRFDWSGHGFVTHSSSTILMFNSTTGGSYRHVHNVGYNHIHNTASGDNHKISGIAYSYDSNYLYATFSFDTNLSGTGFKPYYNIEVIDPSQCTYDVEGI